MDDTERPNPFDDLFDGLEPDPTGFPAGVPTPDAPAPAAPEAGSLPQPPAGPPFPEPGAPYAPAPAPPPIDTAGAQPPIGDPTAGYAAPEPALQPLVDPTAGAPPAPGYDPSQELVEGVDLEGEDDEGSWLMNLDDVVGDRAGHDGIIPQATEAPDLPSHQEVAWSEEAPPTRGAGRVLMPLFAVAVVGMLGWAGWRFVDLRGELATRSPGALDAGSAPKPRAVVPLDGPDDGHVGPKTRQSVGKGPAAGQRGAPRDRNPAAGRPAGAPPASSPGPRVAARSLPPAPTLAPDLPFPTRPVVADAGPPTPPDGVSVAAAPPEPVAVDGGADPAPVPTTIPEPVEPVVPVAPAGEAVAEATVSPETRGRWRSLFGFGSNKPRGFTTPRPTLQPTPDQRVIASSTESDGEASGDGTQTASVLPYGLDAAYIDGWLPPTGPSIDELAPEERPLEYVRAASWRDLTGIWIGGDVPYGSIDEPERTLTPGVGFVAVYMTSGEIVEGVLTEVGHGRVWVQTNAHGRLGLRQGTFDSIDVLGVNGAPGQLVVETLSRVRVATAGGAVYGHLITTDDDRATVFTDTGARITVPRAQVEAIGSEAAVRLNRG